MTKTQGKKNTKLTKTLILITIGVLIFCLALRLFIIGDLEEPIRLTDYTEETAEVVAKEEVTDSPTKIDYTIIIKTSKGLKVLKTGKQDYRTLAVGDSIHILVSSKDIQLGTKAKPYTVIKISQ